MNILTGASDISVDTDVDQPFYNAIIASIRTLANNRQLSVSVGESEDFAQNDFNLPLITDSQNESLRILIRGLSDSFSMMRVHHDPEIHQSLAPHDSAADRLFTLFERERFEEMGSRRFVGVARNLARVWAMSHGQDALLRFGGSEQLEFVLGCLCRETLSGQASPAAVSKFIKPLRGPIEKLVGKQMQQLEPLVFNQADYAKCSLAIIETLGFDISQRTNTQSETAESDVEDSQSQDNSESTDESQSIDDTADADETVHKDSPATTDNPLKIVRKPEHEDDTEPEALDPDTIAPDTLFPETPAFDSSGNSRYKVFDNTEDETCVASALADAEKRQQLRKDLDQHISLHAPNTQKLARQLHRVLLAKQRRFWQQSMDEGEIDPQRLTHFIISPNSSLAYRVLAEDYVRECAVTLLVDNSRSMLGKPIISAAVCADVITRILERGGASTEVLGFTTVSMYGGSVAQRWKDQGCPANVGRLNNIRHIIFKAAGSSWKQSRENFGLMLNGDILKQNIDGEALLWAYRRLRNRPAARRVLMVLTDGRPSDSYTQKANDRHYLIKHLDRVVQQIEKQSDVELVAIGIGHQVSQTYRRSLFVNDLDQLGAIMVNELTGLLAH